MTENYSLWSRKLEGKKSNIFAATMLLDPWRLLARGTWGRCIYHYLLMYKYRKHKEFLPYVLISHVSRLYASSRRMSIRSFVQTQVGAVPDRTPFRRLWSNDTRSI